MVAGSCLITGATRGLGRVLVERFWASGWDLLLVARNEAALNDLIASLASRKGQTVALYPADFAQPDAAQRVAEAVDALLPDIDVLINNAAVQGPVGVLWENDWSDWQAAIRIDLLAPVSLTQAIVPRLIKRSRGSVINLSGGGATAPRMNFSAYSTAKAGLVRFSETLAEELKPYGIRVNCVAPGAMKTSMLAEILTHGAAAAGTREYETAARIIRDGSSALELAAELCLFLASDRSKDITGKLISAVWDDWTNWPDHVTELAATDVYTLRRIAGRDRGFSWGDK